MRMPHADAQFIEVILAAHLLDPSDGRDPGDCSRCRRSSSSWRSAASMRACGSAASAAARRLAPGAHALTCRS